MQPFAPPWLLRGKHAQSILGSVGLRRRRVRSAARDLLAATHDVVIDCGAGVRLLCHHTPPRPGGNGRVVVLIHGWEGSARSTYLLSAATRLWRAGYRIVRMNLRDHGDSHHLNEALFHSCRLDEAIGAVGWVQQTYPSDRLFLCGFSLGGNFVLRIAARADAAGLRPDGTVAVCPVLEPAHTMRVLDDGAAIYRRYFIYKWRASLEKKKTAFPRRYAFERLERFETLTEMTDYFVTHYTEFADLQTYLRGYALTDGRLLKVTSPATVLLADDDPVIPVHDIDRVAVPKCLAVVRCRYGGHCGFLDGYDLQGWADEFIVRAFDRMPERHGEAAE